MSEAIVSEKQSSIEVSENAKKQFSFKVKFYFDETEVDSVEVIKGVERAYAELHKRFK